MADNNIQVPAPKLEGIVRLVKRSADTGEILEDITKNNVITERALSRVLTGGSLGNNIMISSSTTAPDRRVPTITGVLETGFTQPGITTPIFVEDTDTDPMYGEWRKRFNPPSSGTRTINTIALTENSGTGSQLVNCYVVLDSPCEQASNEIVDIFYRVQFLPDYSSGISDFALRGIARYAVTGASSGAPSTAFSMWNGNYGRRDLYNVNALSGSFYYNDGAWDAFSGVWDSWTDPHQNPLSFNSITNIHRYFKKKFSWSIDREWLHEARPVQGRLFGGFNIVNSLNESVARTSAISQQLIDDGLINSIQPVHYHKYDSVHPFQDLDGLSQGEGLIDTAGEWDGKDTKWPSFYKIDIVESGDTGTATYSLSKTNFFRFYGLSWTHLPVTDSLGISSGTQGLIRGMNISNSAKSVKFSKTKRLAWDDENEKNGVAVIDYITGDIEYWNPDTTPAFNPTSIAQCAPETVFTESNNIWVASPSDGLYKIDRGMNTITQISFAEGFIDDTTCYAVDYGKNGEIWALMEGALVRSSDGVSWDVYAPSTGTPFTHADITVGNRWNRVKYMKVNPDPDMGTQIGFVVQDTDQDIRKIVWWDGTQSYSGHTYDRFAFPVHADLNTRWYVDQMINSFTVSEYKGMWNVGYVLSAEDWRILALEFGTTNTTTLRTTSHNAGGLNSNFVGEMYIYDEDNYPYFIAGRDVFDIHLNKVAEVQYPTINLHDNEHPGFIYPGTIIANTLDKGSLQVAMIKGALNPDFSDSYGDKFNHICYEHYGWNSGAGEWQKGYYGTEPANINSGFMRATRHRFQNNQPWLFNGTSSYMRLHTSDIEENIDNIFITVSSTQVPDDNDKCLFQIGLVDDYTDNGVAVNWIDTDNPGKIVLIVGDTKYVIDDRPSDSNKHRLAISLYGNILRVWLDGSLKITHAEIPDYDHTGHMAGIIGGRLNLATLNLFEGNIENFQVSEGQLSQIDIDNDYSNFQSAPTYNYVNAAYNRELNSQVYYIKDEEISVTIDANSIVNFTFNNTNEVGGSTNSYGHFHNFSFQEKIKDGDFIEFKAISLFTNTGTNAHFGVGLREYNDTTGLGGAGQNQRATSAIPFCIKFENNRSNSGIYINDVEVLNTGAWLDTDTWKVEYNATDILFYKNDVLIHTESGAYDINVDGDLYPYGLFAYGSQPGGQGGGTVSVEKYSQIVNTNTNTVVAHYLMTDAITDNGTKVTHTALEDLIDGIEISFNDNPEGVNQWVSSDFYTLAGAWGFLKDNIRTLSGSYSVYYKPAEFDLTDFTPSIVPANSIELDNHTNGLYTENAVVMGDNGSLTGAFHPDHYLIEVDDLANQQYLTIELNGTEVTDRVLQPHNIGISTSQSGTVINFYEYPGFLMTAGETVYLQLDDDSWSTHTISVANTTNITVSPSVSAGNPFKAYGHIVQEVTPDPGQVVIDPVFGIAKFDSGEQGKNVTGIYAALREAT